MLLGVKINLALFCFYFYFFFVVHFKPQWLSLKSQQSILGNERWQIKTSPTCCHWTSTRTLSSIFISHNWKSINEFHNRNVLLLLLLMFIFFPLCILCNIFMRNIILVILGTVLNSLAKTMKKTTETTAMFSFNFLLIFYDIETAFYLIDNRFWDKILCQHVLNTCYFLLHFVDVTLWCSILMPVETWRAAFFLSQRQIAFFHRLYSTVYLNLVSLQ